MNSNAKWDEGEDFAVGVRVVLSGHSIPLTLETYTDATGLFMWRDLPIATYWLDVYHNGVPTMRYSVRPEHIFIDRDTCSAPPAECAGWYTTVPLPP